MVRKCLAFGCRGNYKSELYSRMLGFLLIQKKGKSGIWQCQAIVREMNLSELSNFYPP